MWILIKILTEITRHPRQIVVPGIDFNWSPNCWTHNVFRVYELVFGRRAGIRWEGTSYLNEDGNTVQISGTIENFLAVFEGAVRAYFKSWNLGWRIVYVPQLVGIPTGLQSPFMFAIAFDAVTTFDNGGTENTSFTYAKTCTGSNLTLIINGYFNELGAPTVNSVTYNAVSASNGVTSISGNQNIFLYYLAAPSTGSNNVVLTPSKLCLCASAAMSFTGTAAIPNGATATSGAAQSSSTPTTSTTTTTTNSWVVDHVGVFAPLATENPVTTGTNQTSRYAATAIGAANQLLCGSSQITTSIGTYTQSWSLSVIALWQSVAFEVNALATVSNIIVPTLSFLGAG